MTIDIDSTRAVLADAEWTKEVVRAAAVALNALTDVRPDGLTPDGDDPAMTARSILNTAFLDWDAIAQAAD